MNTAAIRKNLSESSDAELMAIATGAASGYTPAAQEIAAGILVERGVPLPHDLNQQREHARQVEKESESARETMEEEEDRASQRSWGVRLLVLGAGSFILPMFGLQFRLLKPFGLVAGVVCAVVGLVVLARTDPQIHKEPPRRITRS